MTTFDDISNGTEFLSEKAENPIRIKVVGVGGGGNNAINHMYRQGIKDVSFAVINTDRKALLASPVPTKLQIGPGMGAGNKPEKALQLAEESAAEIDELFNDSAEMVFITAGMGGGTGTGAAPVVARIAKERGLLTLGIVTIPFLFEGDKKILKALDGADEMSKYVDALMIINNERLTEIYPDIDFLNAFAKADDTLLMAAQSISDLITCDARIFLDIEDVKTTLRDSHTAIISSGFGEGEHRVTKAIEDALNSPLLRNNDILTSTRLLFNVYISRNASHPFQMKEANEITEFVSSLHSEVDVIWGVGFDDTLDDQVKITILAAGFEISSSRKRKPAPAVTPKQTPDPLKPEREPRKQEFSAPQYEAPRPVQNPVPETPVSPVNTPATELPRAAKDNRLADLYGDRASDVRRQKTASRYIVLSPEQLDDDSAIDIVERTPAYNRDRKIMSAMKSGSQALPKPARDPNVIDFSDDF